MSLKDKWNGVVRKVGLKLITHELLKLFADAQSGKLGPAWQRRYVFAQGKTTWTGMALMVAGIACAAYGPPEAAAYVAGAGAFLASVGLVKRGYHTDIPAGVAQATWYRFIATHGELVAGLLVTASALLKGPADCEWCLVADKIVMVAGLTAAQLKLIDPAWRAKPPIVDLDVLSRYVANDVEKNDDGVNR